MSIQTAKAARQSIQSVLGVEPDGKIGPKTLAQLNRLVGTPDDLPWPPAPSSRTLDGDGTWPWTAEIDGNDIVVINARATCFGGSNDPQDNGDTASGISTKKNPDLAAVSLPMDGRQFPGAGHGAHAALDGSPIPKVPWKTLVRVEAMGMVYEFPVIDLGPGKRTGNALDLTIAAARMFNPRASATNFEMRCTYRILGGAKYAA